MTSCAGVEPLHPFDRIPNPVVTGIGLQPRRCGCPIRTHLGGAIGLPVRAPVAGILVSMRSAEASIEAIAGGCTNRVAAAHHLAPAPLVIVRLTSSGFDLCPTSTLNGETHSQSFNMATPRSDQPRRPETSTTTLTNPARLCQHQRARPPSFAAPAGKGSSVTRPWPW